MTGKERRVHPRVLTPLLVHYRFPSRADFLKQYASDISRGGMFIRTDDPCQVGQVLCLQFVLEDGGKLIEGSGTVVHANTGERAPRGMGIEFLNLEPESVALIDDIVAKRSNRERGGPA